MEGPVLSVIHRVPQELRDFALRARPATPGGRWAKIPPLLILLWMTLEQARPFRQRFRKRKASLVGSGIISLRRNLTPKGGLP
jgi:hypothetical protein